MSKDGIIGISDGIASVRAERSLEEEKGKDVGDDWRFTKEFVNVLQLTSKVKGYARHRSHYKLRESLNEQISGLET